MRFIKFENNKALGTVYIAEDNIAEFVLQTVKGKYGLAIYTKVPDQVVGFSYDTEEEREKKVNEILKSN